MDLQGHRSGVDWQSIEHRPTSRRKGVQPVQYIQLVKDLGVELERRVRGEDAGRAAPSLLV